MSHKIYANMYSVYTQVFCSVTYEARSTIVKEELQDDNVIGPL